MSLRKAKVSDFKVGAKLTCNVEGWSLVLLSKCDDGIWEARGVRGDTCVFEVEAGGYLVEGK
jgi:hypothetical protein